MLKKIVVACSLMLISTLGHAASFDCKKAKAPIEKTICNDAELNNMDSKLGEVYKNWLNDSGKTGKFIKKTQAFWLKWRAEQCDVSVASCLLSLYEERISLLEFYLTDPFQVSEIGQIVGIYSAKNTGLEMFIEALNHDEVFVHISGEDDNKRWSCSFNGRGKLSNNTITLTPLVGDVPAANNSVTLKIQKNGSILAQEQTTTLQGKVVNVEQEDTEFCGGINNFGEISAEYTPTLRVLK